MREPVHLPAHRAGHERLRPLGHPLEMRDRSAPLGWYVAPLQRADRPAGLPERGPLALVDGPERDARGELARPHLARGRATRAQHAHHLRRVLPLDLEAPADPAAVPGGRLRRPGLAPGEPREDQTRPRLRVPRTPQRLLQGGDIEVGRRRRSRLHRRRARRLGGEARRRSARRRRGRPARSRAGVATGGPEERGNHPHPSEPDERSFLHARAASHEPAAENSAVRSPRRSPDTSWQPVDFSAARPADTPSLRFRCSNTPVFSAPVLARARHPGCSRRKFHGLLR